MSSKRKFVCPGARPIRSGLFFQPTRLKFFRVPPAQARGRRSSNRGAVPSRLRCDGAAERRDRLTARPPRPGCRAELCIVMSGSSTVLLAVCAGLGGVRRMCQGRLLLHLRAHALPTRLLTVVRSIVAATALLRIADGGSGFVGCSTAAADDWRGHGHQEFGAMAFCGAACGAPPALWSP